MGFNAESAEERRYAEKTKEEKMCSPLLCDFHEKVAFCQAGAFEFASFTMPSMPTNGRHAIPTNNSIS